MNEITTIHENFNGVTVTLHQIDDDLWFTSKDGAEALGIKLNSFQKLAREHRGEMLPSEVKVDSRSTLSVRGHAVTLYRLSVLDLLAPLTTTDVSAKIRRWTADVRQRFRRGESAEITREQFLGMKAELGAVVAENKSLRETLLEDRKQFLSAITSMSDSSKTIASLASQIMHERKTQKALETDAADTKQLRLWRPWTAEIASAQPSRDGTVGEVA